MADESKAFSLSEPDTWVDLYGDVLYRFAMARLKDPAIAEEVVQETFLAALRSRDNFQGRSSEKTWLIAILKHKIMDHFRKKRPEESRDDIETFSDTPHGVFNQKGAWHIPPKNWRIDPRAVYEQHEFMDVLYRCLADIPKRPADAFRLREIEGLTTEEICKLLNITATNCWVMLYRARMALRRCLEINWFEHGG